MSLTYQASPLFTRLISSSVAIANHAGKIIRDVMSEGELGIVQKEHAHDLQTEADRAAQRCIIGSLASHFPKLTIIGEEDEVGGNENLIEAQAVPVVDITFPSKYDSLKEEEFVVWVDPLDGTSEYTQAHECSVGGHQGVCKTLGLECSSLLDHVTVLIGIAAGGQALGGVIHQPYYNYKNPGEKLGRTVWGVVGGSVGGLTINPPPTDGCIVTTTRSHSSSTVNDAVACLQPTEVLKVGGAGHKVMLLLEGKAHVYMFASPGCKKWDTCGPQAVLEAVGGTLTDVQGNLIRYDASVPHRNSTGVVASAPGQPHSDFITKIPQHVKENLKL